MAKIDKIISSTQKNLSDDLSASKSRADLETLRIKYLGKNGVVNKLFQSLEKSEKAKFGQIINGFKKDITSRLTQTEKILDSQADNITEDLTIPGTIAPIGHLHLITQAINEIEQIFNSLGFTRRRYREIETDWYYAEGLNIPADHPARDDQETFYISSDTVLTAHTSNGQLREMESVKNPPIRMINIGKTYRRQLDVSHSPMFHQFEGMLVDKDINITHLLGVSDYFAKQYFGPDREIRLRPHHFQFTEPSFELDISCQVCHGKGCRLCKAGWLELGGAGMIHPQVLHNGGINPDNYSGFAFGWGVERVLMMKYGLPDIRQVYSTDLRLLTQF